MDFSNWKMPPKFKEQPPRQSDYGPPYNYHLARANYFDRKARYHDKKADVYLRWTFLMAGIAVFFAVISLVASALS